MRVPLLLLLASLLFSLKLTPLYLGTDQGCKVGVEVYNDTKGYHITLSKGNCNCGCDVLAEILITRIREGNYVLTITYRIDNFDQGFFAAKIMAPSLLIANEDLEGTGIEIIPSWKIWDGAIKLASTRVTLYQPFSTHDEFPGFYKVVFPRDPRVLIGSTITVRMNISAEKINNATLVSLKSVRVEYKELNESCTFDKKIDVTLKDPAVIFYVRSGVYSFYALRNMTVTIENVTLSVQKGVERPTPKRVRLVLTELLRLLYASNNYASLGVSRALLKWGSSLLFVERSLLEVRGEIRSLKEERRELQRLLSSPPTVKTLNRIYIYVQIVNTTIMRINMMLNEISNTLKKVRPLEVECAGNATLELLKLLESKSVGKTMRIMWRVGKVYGSLENLTKCFLKEERERVMNYLAEVEREASSVVKRWYGELRAYRSLLQALK